MSKLVVVGSANTDFVVKTSRLPRKGETVLGGDFSMFCGGKGANQAVAAARFGGDVDFIGKIGSDIFGANVLDNFKKIGINTNHILVNNQCPTGVALITVDDSGENSIVVSPGANNTLDTADIDNVLQVFDGSAFILMQLEIPLKTLEYVLNIAGSKKIPVILNPAPAAVNLSAAILGGLYLITPNETEAAMLSGVRIDGIDDARRAAIIIHELGVKQVVITLGNKGAVCFDGMRFEVIPPVKVTTVDTTAAGDTFNGVLAAALADSFVLSDALKISNAAAALSTTKMGAQKSIPCREEIMSLMSKI